MNNRFAFKLLHWYAQNKRDLPWRNSLNPYQIWISEIILQQTRVDQGLEYFNRFIKQFPDIESIALATEDDILLLWQGLGYYSRARNIKNTANYIYEHYQGVFPNTFKDIIALKGIGNYTAAAIASIAYNLPHPAIDGNVIRIISRIYKIEEPMNSKKGKDLIAEMLNLVFLPERAGDFNQALMDFGALICKPKAPLCNQCTFAEDCQSFYAGNVENFPVKIKKNTIKKRFFNFLILKVTEKKEVLVYLHQRTANDIWKQLFEFPLIESGKLLSENEILKNTMLIKISKGIPFKITNISEVITHKLTHQTILAQFFIITINNALKEAEKFNLIKVNINDLKHFAFPKLIVNYINQHIVP